MALDTVEPQLRLSDSITPEDIAELWDYVVVDDEPVDSIFAARQMRLLVEAISHSWRSPDGKPFYCESNVGLFYQKREHPLVPDVMLSLRVPTDLPKAARRSYFAWIWGKLPEVVIEIVSKTKNDEDGRKLRKYEEIGVENYVIHDPDCEFGKEVLRVFKLVDGKYVQSPTTHFSELGLGLKLWHGKFANEVAVWLRWCDSEGKLLPTQDEKDANYREDLEMKDRRIEEEMDRADTEKHLAELDRIKLRREMRSEMRNAATERLAKERQMQLVENERLEKEMLKRLIEEERLEKEEQRQLAEKERLEKEVAIQQALAAQEQLRLLQERLKQLGID